MIVRPAVTKDMDAIYLMGIDVWGEGQTEEEYLADCRNSIKYKLGEWHCLTEDGVIVSSLITYQNQFGLADRYVGMGSIATYPDHRRKGYAGCLIQNCIDRCTEEKCLGLLLFSDVESSYYERFGFTAAESEMIDPPMFLSLNGGRLPELPRYF